MRTHRRVHDRRRGQALVMVTLAIVAMAGMIGLAVDLGWSYSVRRAAQNAADSAALAAVQKAWDDSGHIGNITCGTPGVTCLASATSCSAAVTGSLASACLYAQQNGFSGAGTQDVSVQADVTSPPPTAPGFLTVKYWVTVRISERIPQLFSAVVGNTRAIVTARATAGLTETVVDGTLVMLNRPGDTPQLGGVDFQLGMDGTVNAPGGVKLASRSASSGSIVGNGVVHTPHTWICCGGALSLGTNSTWEHTDDPANPNSYINKPDGADFQDPVAGMGQPPLTSSTLPTIAVPGGTLSCPANICRPGNYFATNAAGAPTVAPILLDNRNLSFQSSSGFGDYNFFGGLRITRSTVNFGPGRYVMAGALTAGTAVFSADSNSIIAGGSGANAGTIFILTNSTYPGLSTQVAAVNAAVAATHVSLPAGLANFGVTDIQAGNTTTSSITLNGLDRAHSLPVGTNSRGYSLADFAPAVIWQDQRNSKVKYTADGNIDTSSCGAGHTLDSPCANASGVSPKMSLKAVARATYNGLVYQPRGAYLEANGGLGPGSLGGALQIITGAMIVGGSADVGGVGMRLNMPLTQVTLPPLTNRANVLVE